VNFAGVPVGNADLACLDNLLALRKLDLRGTKITDDGLASLAKQQKLETLDISSTRITNAGLLHVGKLRNLRSLSVRYLATTYPRHHPESSNPFDSTLEISAEGVKAPQLLVPPPPWSLPGVVDDSNQQLGIGDAGLEHLSQLNRLESLDLEETDVTSEGISQLSGLSQLTYLCVRGTDVSEAAITDLKHALPQLKVQQGLSAGMRPDALSRSIFFSLAEGANKSIVRALCGEPKTTQASGDSEYWYYRGASYDPETGTPDQSVEVVFKSGIVTGVNFKPR
jgi:Leucine Rich repeat